MDDGEGGEVDRAVGIEAIVFLDVYPRRQDRRGKAAGGKRQLRGRGRETLPQRVHGR